MGFIARARLTIYYLTNLTAALSDRFAERLIYSLFISLTANEVSGLLSFSAERGQIAQWGYPIILRLMLQWVL